MKRLLAALAAALLLLLPVSAQPPTTTPLDPVTGLPADQTGDSVMEDGVIMLGENWGYDPLMSRYICQVGESTFVAQQPPGVLLSQGGRASFQIPTSLTVEITHNGNPYEETDLLYITQTGNYLLQVSDGIDTFRFPFSIVPAVSRSLVEYTLPPGFYVDGLWLNDQAQEITYSNYTDFKSEGLYRLDYSSPQVGRSYTLTFTADRTAPTLPLPQVSNGEAFGPVSLEGLEKDAYVLVDRDGLQSYVTDPEHVLDTPGRYQLTVSDQAGNSTQYQFVIHVYLDISAAVALGLLLALVASVIGYSRWVRTHARVG